MTAPPDSISNRTSATKSGRSRSTSSHRNRVDGWDWSDDRSRRRRRLRGARSKASFQHGLEMRGLLFQQPPRVGLRFMQHPFEIVVAGTTLHDLRERLRGLDGLMDRIAISRHHVALAIRHNSGGRGDRELNRIATAHEREEPDLAMGIDQMKPDKVRRVDLEPDATRARAGKRQLGLAAEGAPAFNIVDTDHRLSPFEG